MVLHWRRNFSVILVSCVLVPPGVLSAEPCPDDSPGRTRTETGGECSTESASRNREEERMLVSQKLSLLEAFLTTESSERARRSGGTRESAMIAQADGLLGRAKKDVEDGKLQQAARALDEGLKLASQASSLAPRRTQSSGAKEKQKYLRQMGQIESYLEVIKGILGNRTSGDRSVETLTEIETLVAKTKRLAAVGNYPGANEQLSVAYDKTITLVSGLRSGETLVSNLEFATPSEEFEYERQRHESYRMLVSLVKQDQHEFPDTLLSMIGRYEDESEKFRSKAEQTAAAGEFEEAIVTMEEATGSLMKILQASGIVLPQ